MSMKFEKTENANELKLEFTIEAEKFEQAIKSVYVQNSKYFNIPGFRKGKAPFEMAEKMYGTEIFYEDAFNELVPPVFEEELKANNIEAVSKPEIEVKQMEKGKDLIFTAIIQTKPEVKLGKYKGIQLKKIEYNVSDEDINKELTSMAERNSRLVAVEDRPVEVKDTVVFDFEGFVDGKTFEGGKAEGYELEIGSNTFIPGFEDQMVGMKKGETRDLNLTFPENYGAADLAGADVEFTVTVHKIEVKKEAVLNDEIVASLNVPEMKTVEDLRTQLKENIQAQHDQQYRNNVENAIFEKLIQDSDVEVDAEDVLKAMDQHIQHISMQLASQGMALEQYLQMMGSTEEALRQQLEPAAKQQAIFEAIIDEVIQVENIETTDEEVDQQVEMIAQQNQLTKEQVLKIVDLSKQNKYSQVELSKMFDTSEGTISRILSGLRWSSVTGIKYNKDGSFCCE